MTTPPNRPSSGRRSLSRKSSLGGLALVAVVALYSFARPGINERTGWNLPDLKLNSQGEVVAANQAGAQSQSVPAAVSDEPQASRESAGAKPMQPRAAEVDAAKQSAETVAHVTAPPTRPRSTKTSESRTSTPEVKSPASTLASPTPAPAKSTSTKDAATDGELRYGLLRDLGGDRYMSPAGLLYTRGSAEGHRIEHLRRHTEDDPSRPGSHGVFDGGIEGALALVDAAYERAKQGIKTTKTEDDGRVIYTVDMGKRVGFVGGRDGRSKRNPMARRIRIVLESNRVITAYPM